MTVRVNQAARNARVDAVRNQIDAGGAAGYAEVRTGGQPAAITDAATGTLLVTLPLNLPSFPNASAGAATLDNDPVVEQAAVAGGTPGWVRFYASDATPVMDLTVGTSGADLTLNTASVVAGQNVKVDDVNPLVLTDPA